MVHLNAEVIQRKYLMPTYIFYGPLAQLVMTNEI